jgi:drug/metabolite transporter (DMT)-like permease
MPALQLAGMRQVAGGVIYILFFLGKKAIWPDRKQWSGILVLGFLNFFLTNGLTTWGVKYISAGLGSIISAAFPLWLALFGMRKPGSVQGMRLLGLLAGFAGICIIFYEHISDFLRPEFRFGILISLIGSFSWTLGTIYTKAKAPEFNPYFSIGLQMFISGVFLCVLNALAGQHMALSEIPWQSWTAISYLVVIGSVITFAAYLYALQNLPTQLVSVYAYINPVVAVLTGSLLFGEKLSLLIGLGGLLTLYGIYLVSRPGKTPVAEN